ncbi:MAG: OmpA family protein [Sphingomicrobium sp.]
MRKAFLLLLAIAMTPPAAAQRRLPVIIPLGRSSPQPAQPPELTGIDALRADFLVHSGADTVYFGTGSAILGAPAQATLQAQATWLRLHPEVVVRVEGHAEPSETRDHALAIGARRAEQVRNDLVLLGVRAAQIGTMSWGKERPGPPRAVTILVR